LEGQTAIEEAWLNRAGTIVAIVWSGPARTSEVAKRAFDGMRPNFASGLTIDKLLSDTRETGFRGAEVDRLSLEEAREIAETSVFSAGGHERLTNRTVDDGTRILTISAELPKIALAVMDRKLTRCQVSPAKWGQQLLGSLSLPSRRE
jgi:hypothetical protein